MLRLVNTFRSLVERYLGTNPAPIYNDLPLEVSQREIRLVHIDKGEWNDEIECTLRVASLNSELNFEALSYAWGRASHTRPLSLNRYRLEIGANLHSALRRLRLPERDRVLWVDAICINQHDVPERNKQVHLMRDIYRVCRNVVIWLDGPEIETTALGHPRTSHEWFTDFSQLDEACAVHRHDEVFLAKFERDVETYYQLPFSLRHSMRIDNHMGAYCLLVLLALDKHINRNDIPYILNRDAFHGFIIALDKIMSCKWWSRQWVIQELVLPSKANVHFDNLVAPWELFSRAARNYDKHRTSCCKDHYTHLNGNDIRLLEQFSRKVLEMDDLRRHWHKLAQGDHSTHITLRQLLWKFRDRGATDPRDKVYTLVPLVDYWNGQHEIQQDYFAKPQHVFRAAAQKVIAVDNTLDILMGTMEKNMSGLPSWVPDWTAKAPQFEEERLERCSLFGAALDHALQIDIIQDTYMKVSGIEFDEIITVAGIMDFSSNEISQELFAEWYSITCRSMPMTAAYPSGGTRLDAYWRTLCLDTVRSLDTRKVGTRYSRCSKDYVRDCQQKWMDAEGMPLYLRFNTGDDMADVAVPANDLSRGIDTVLNFVAVDFAICSATWGRRLFFTKRGYIGLGPPTVEEGDTVQILGGGSMPFVLRNGGQKRIPTEGWKECHQLLGECYLHGIMDGEAAEGYEEQKIVTYLM
jgi:hypothetical protein